MADFRTVQTRMWREDEWFQNLATDARLLWVYLFTNPSANAAGLYRLPIRTIAFESGIELSQVERLLGEFAEANKAHYEAGIVYVVKMQALQHGDISWQVATRIAADVDAIPEGRLKGMYLERYGYPIVEEKTDDKGKIIRSLTYRYPIDTPSIPHRYTDTVTDTSTVTVTDHLAPQAQANDGLTPEARAINNAYDASGIVMSKTHKDEHMETIKRYGLPAWQLGFAAALNAGKHNVPAYVRRCAETAHIAETQGGQHATNRRNGSGASKEFGLRRQPGDVAAPDPTDEEKREWAEWRLQQAASAG